MSINVTVHGNPISIKRGKIVSLDSDQEFGLRRKIRLQQVRQQSNEIAEDVRSKVRKEKNKQLNKAKNEVQKSVNEQQKNTLSCLQKKYQNSLDDFGAAYKDADVYSNPEDVIGQLTKHNQEIAESRGKAAMQKKKCDTKNQIEGSQKIIQGKKQAREIENIRSKLVSGLQNNKKAFKKRRKRVFTDIVINGFTEEVSDESSNFSDLSILQEELEEKMTQENPSNLKKIPCETQNAFKEKCVFKDIENEKPCELLHMQKTNSSVLNQCDDIDERFEEKNDFLTENQEYSSKESYRSHCNKNFNDEKQKNIHENNSDSGCSDEERFYNLSDEGCNVSGSSHRDKFDRDNMCQTPKNHDGNIFNDIENEDPAWQIQKVPSKTQKKFYYKSSQTPYKSEKKIKTCILTKRQKNPKVRKPLVSSLNCKQDNSLISPKKVNPHFKPVIVSQTYNNNMESTSKTNNEKHIKTKKSSIRKKYSSSYKKKDSNLPCVPTVTLKSDVKNVEDIPTQYYNHFNRYSTKQLRPTIVTKINKEDCKTSPTLDNNEKRENKHEHEEARIRGHKALEKMKIRRDYQQLLNELPILKRQEQFTAMQNHDSLFHMSDERHHQFERKKQNLLENSFENFESRPNSNNPPLVTLKSSRNIISTKSMKEPFQTLDITENSLQILNVGQWQRETSQTSIGSSEENVSSQHETPLTNITEHNNLEEKAITDLLKRINKQRDLLLRQAATLPSLVNLKNILNEKELLEIVCNQSEPLKILKETSTSPFKTEKDLLLKNSSDKNETKKNNEKKLKDVKSSTKKQMKKKETHSVTVTSSSSTSFEISESSSSKFKGRKNDRKQKIIIREEATQTSPLVNKLNFTTTNSKKEESTQTMVVLENHYHNTEKTAFSKSSKEDNGFNQSSFAENVCEIVIRPACEHNLQLSHQTNVKDKVSQEHISSKKDSKPILDKVSNVIIKIKEQKEKDQKAYRTNFLEMSTSTSYWSPPADTKISDNRKTSRLSSNKEFLKPQQQQTNFNQIFHVECDSNEEMNHRLLRYIKKLLSMSRQSIDELTISSVSDVSTPHESILQTSRNQAIEKLQSVVEHFNLNPEDIKKYCSISSSGSPSDIVVETDFQEIMQPTILTSSEDNNQTTVNSITENSCNTNEYEKLIRPVSPEPHKSRKYQMERNNKASCNQNLEKQETETRSFTENICKARQVENSNNIVPVQNKKPIAETITSFKEIKNDTEIKQSEKNCIDHTQIKNIDCGTTESFLKHIRQYLDMTNEEFSALGLDKILSKDMEYCQCRIKTLVDIIEKIRADKTCTPSPDDGTITFTTYLDLPSTKHDVDNKYENEQNIINEKDDGRIKRYNNQMGNSEPDSISKNILEHQYSLNEQKDNSEKFIPLLQGIPKYTVTDSFTKQSPLVTQKLNHIKPKPPPTLLRANKRGYVNEDPHELSTIVEAETVISSRNTSIHCPQSPNPKFQPDTLHEHDTSSNHSQNSNSIEYVTITPEKNTDLIKQMHFIKNNKVSTPSIAEKNDEAFSKIRPKSGLSGVQPLSDSTIESPDDLENLLRKFKLDWALSLVKKTEQTLAFSSSSSTSDLESAESKFDADVMDLYKHIYKTLLSSSSSDIDQSHALSDMSIQLKEFNDLSKNYLPISQSRIESKNKSQQRTSTPVQFSISSNSSKENLFKCDSELSSVKNISDDNIFLTVPNLSLNTTNYSLNKSKK